jgi:hypothetical protein
MAGVESPVTSVKASGLAVLEVGRASVAETAVTADSLIFLTVQLGGGTIGQPYVASKEPGVGFVISSLSAYDTSTVAWFII